MPTTLVSERVMRGRGVADRSRAMWGRRTRPPRRTDLDLLITGPHALALAALLADAYPGRVGVVDDPLARGRHPGPLARRRLMHGARLLAMAHADLNRSSTASPSMRDLHLLERIRSTAPAIEPDLAIATLEQRGIRCFRGIPAITKPFHVHVDTRQLSARSIVIASDTTTLSNGMAIDGSDDDLTLWSWKSLPRTVAVVGCGSRIFEISQMLARFGCRVLALCTDPRPLPGCPVTASSLLLERLTSDGIAVRMIASGLSAHRHDRGFLLEYSVDGRPERFDAERVVATGLTVPDLRSSGLDAECARVQAGRGDVFDGFHRTDLDGAVACGEIQGPDAFSHPPTRSRWFECLAAFLSGDRRVGDAFPRILLTDPEIASFAEPVGGASGAPAGERRFRCGDGRGHLSSTLAIDRDPSTGPLRRMTIIGWQAGERLADLRRTIDGRGDAESCLDRLTTVPIDQPGHAPADDLIPLVALDPPLAAPHGRPANQHASCVIAALVVLLLVVILAMALAGP